MGLKVCSLLTSVRKIAAEALTLAASSFTPVSYAQALMKGSAGSSTMPSVCRKPLEMFA